MKTLLYLFYLLIILGLFIAGLYLWPDERLQPEVEDWLQVEKSSLPSEQNGFFTLVGLLAAADQDPYSVGVEGVTMAKKTLLQHQETMGELNFENYPARDLEISDEVKESLCETTETACLENFATQAEMIRRIIAEHQVLMNRYQSLYTIKGYQDNLLPATPETPLPSFNQLMRLNQLQAAEIGVEYMIGDKAKAVQMLQQDIEFVRLLLANTSLLITKMVARKMLVTDLHLYAQMLDQTPLAAEVIALADKLPTLSITERSLEKVIRYEFQMISHFILNFSKIMRQESSIEFSPLEYEDLYWWTLSWWTFKPNATVNRTYSKIKYVVDLSHLPTTQFSSYQASPAKKPSIWDYLYNGAGTLLNNEELATYDLYVYRLIDLEGLIRLVQLKQRIRSQNITESQMAQFLTDHAKNYGNPYTGEPMLWNAERQVLYFENSVETTNKPYYRELALAITK
jgi:hypothetical protein